MKTFLAFILIPSLQLLTPRAAAQVPADSAGINRFQAFDDSFLNKTLRIDYFLAGNSADEKVYFREMKEEPNMAGLIETYISCQYRDLQVLPVRFRKQ